MPRKKQGDGDRESGSGGLAVEEKVVESGLQEKTALEQSTEQEQVGTWGYGVTSTTKALW